MKSTNAALGNSTNAALGNPAYEPSAPPMPSQLANEGRYASNRAASTRPDGIPDRAGHNSPQPVKSGFCFPWCKAKEEASHEVDRQGQPPTATVRPSAPPMPSNTQSQPMGASIYPPNYPWGTQQNFMPPASVYPAPVKPQSDIADDSWLKKLGAQRDNFTADGKQAIKHLEDHDSRCQQPASNGEIRGHSPDQDGLDSSSRYALTRRASFVLLTEILSDLPETVGRNSYAGSLQLPPDHERLLLTAQIAALKNQVAESNKEMLRKCRDGERYQPMMLREAVFKNYLRENSDQLKLLIDACRHTGTYRQYCLPQALKNLASAYLETTKMLPSGLINTVFKVDGQTWTPESGPFDLLIVPSDRCVVPHFTSSETFALIILSHENCHLPSVDPLKGKNIERLYSKPFEQCDIPQRQAAVYLQKLFSELADLETQMAVVKGEVSILPSERKLAERTKQDVGYRGSAKVGDRFAEFDPPADYERNKLSLNVAKVVEMAHLYSSNFGAGKPLLLDPDLNEYVLSVEFQEDLRGLEFPEKRLWDSCVKAARKALLSCPEFQATSEPLPPYYYF